MSCACVRVYLYVCVVFAYFLYVCVFAYFLYLCVFFAYFGVFPSSRVVSVCVPRVRSRSLLCLDAFLHRQFLVIAYSHVMKTQPPLRFVCVMTGLRDGNR
jgi:hypothetical protein